MSGANQGSSAPFIGLAQPPQVGLGNHLADELHRLEVESSEAVTRSEALVVMATGFLFEVDPNNELFRRNR